MGIFGRSRADQQLIDQLRERTEELMLENAEQQEIMELAHYRNPRTGRLGRRGMIFAPYYDRDYRQSMRR